MFNIMTECIGKLQLESGFMHKLPPSKYPKHLYILNDLMFSKLKKEKQKQKKKKAPI